MIFLGVPSPGRLLATLLAFAAAVVAFADLVILIVGAAMGSAPAGRGLVIAGCTTLVSAAMWLGVACLLWRT